MGLLIDDSDVCPKCGSYWQLDFETGRKSWCADGHPYVLELERKD